MQNLEATILSQFANSPVLLTLIQNLNGYIDPAVNIEAFLDDIWDLNTAQGYGLDVWGRIVGVGRVYQVASASFLGFSGVDGGSGDSFDTQPFYNGNATTSNYALTDPAYRVLILTKAMANLTDGSIPSINAILTYLNTSLAAQGFSVPGNCYCTDLGGMRMTYTFVLGMTTLPPLVQSIVSQTSVLPRPPGVAASIVVM